MVPDFKLPALTRLVRLAAPLGLVMLLLSITINGPRYFVANTLGPVQLGAFAAMTYLWLFGLTGISAVGQALSPRLAAEFGQGNRSSFIHTLSLMLSVGLALGLVMVAAVVLGGHFLLALIYRGDYQDGGWTFVTIAGAGALGFIGSVLGFAMTATRQLDVQIPIFAVVMAVSIISSAVLIPRLGLTGAAFAGLFSFGAQVILSAAVVFNATTSIRLGGTGEY
jgi:O-antigen/teichoic acid export membrane protein